jgi:hypothetical protein
LGGQDGGRTQGVEKAFDRKGFDHDYLVAFPVSVVPILNRCLIADIKDDWISIFEGHCNPVSRRV